MVLGCIFCRQPLVTYIGLAKKKQYFKGQLRKDEKEEPTAGGAEGAAGGATAAAEPNKVEIKETQLVLSKCGHIFHKNCLKSYITHNTNLGGNSCKRECPFCFKQIVIGQCINIFLNVEPNDTLVEKVRGINDQNDELHAQLGILKTDLAEKNQDLTLLNKEISKCKHATRSVLKEAKKLEDIEDPRDLVRELKVNVEQHEKFANDLTDQNTKIVSLIEQQATHYQQVLASQGKRARMSQFLVPKHHRAAQPYKIKTHLPSPHRNRRPNSSSLREEFHSPPIDLADHIGLGAGAGGQDDDSAAPFQVVFERKFQMDDICYMKSPGESVDSPSAAAGKGKQLPRVMAYWMMNKKDRKAAAVAAATVTGTGTGTATGTTTAGTSVAASSTLKGSQRLRSICEGKLLQRGQKDLRFYVERQLDAVAIATKLTREDQLRKAEAKLAEKNKKKSQKQKQKKKKLSISTSPNCTNLKFLFDNFDSTTNVDK